MAPDDGQDELVTIAAYGSEGEAREHARLLVENGIGPVIRPGVPAELVPDGGDPTDEHAAAFSLRVLRHQVRSACQVLGIDPPAEAAAAMAAATPDVAPDGKPPTPWKKILLVWLAAMILIPGGAFWITYFVLSR